MGLRASGKTTVGRHLATVLSRPFTDLDEVTAGILGEERAGTALARHGEARFREAEADALERVLHERPQVVSLGGGTPTAPRAYRLLLEARAAGLITTAYLHADCALLRARLEADPTPRPSLTGLGTIAEVEQIYARRDPLYRELADRVLDASRPVDQIVGELARRP
jgi:shikimate kinase